MQQRMGRTEEGLPASTVGTRAVARASSQVQPVAQEVGLSKGPQSGPLGASLILAPAGRLWIRGPQTFP